MPATCSGHCQCNVFLPTATNINYFEKKVLDLGGKLAMFQTTGINAVLN